MKLQQTLNKVEFIQPQPDLQHQLDETFDLCENIQFQLQSLHISSCHELGAYLHLCTNNSNIDSIIGNCQKYFEPSGNIQFPRRSLLFNAGAACHKIILSFLAKLVGGECGNGDMKQVKNSLKHLYQVAAEEKVVVDQWFPTFF